MTARVTMGLVGEVVTGLITLVWTVSFVTALINPAYRPDPSISSLMAIVVGGLVALQAKRHHDGEGHHDQ